MARTLESRARQATELLRFAFEPSRLAVILLLERGEMDSGDVGAALGSPRPTTSGRLTMLHHVRVLTRRRQGRRVLYGLSESGRLLAELFRVLGERLGR